MSNDTITKHHVIKITGNGQLHERKVQIVGTHSSIAAAGNQWEHLDNARIHTGHRMNSFFFAIREDGHEWVEEAHRQANLEVAAENIAHLKPLTEKQVNVLRAIAANSEARRGFRPNGKGFGGFGHSTDALGVAKALETKGLVTILGVPFGPKTFFVTRLGRDWLTVNA